MLRDVIRDWFVQYIFGGINSNGDFFETLWGDLYRWTGNGFVTVGSFNGDIAVPTGFLQVDYSGGESTSLTETLYLTVGDYLSNLATLITISLMVICLFSLVVCIFKQLKHITWVV